MKKKLRRQPGLLCFADHYGTSAAFRFSGTGPDRLTPYFQDGRFIRPQRDRAAFRGKFTVIVQQRFGVLRPAGQTVFDRMLREVSDNEEAVPFVLAAEGNDFFAVMIVFFDIAEDRRVVRLFNLQQLLIEAINGLLRREILPDVDLSALAVAALPGRFTLPAALAAVPGMGTLA